MRATDILKEEHKVIKRMIAVLEKVCENINSKREVNIEELEMIVDFIRNFADKCHHAKEQDLLFPAMQEAGIPKEGGPIGVMLEEHEMGRSFVRGMAEAIDEYKIGKKEALKNFAENGLNYSNLLTEHIYKEDNILYMMADMHLSENQQQKLLEDFELVEKEMGEGVHKKYHNIVEKLEKIYLG